MPSPTKSGRGRTPLLAALPLAIGLAAGYQASPPDAAVRHATRPAPFSAVRRTGAAAEGLCALGEPVKDTAVWDFGATKIIARAGYELIMTPTSPAGSPSLRTTRAEKRAMSFPPFGLVAVASAR